MAPPTTVALLGIMVCADHRVHLRRDRKPGPNRAFASGSRSSFWVFGAGAVMGIAGAQMLARVNRPPDLDLMEDAMNPDQF